MLRCAFVIVVLVAAGASDRAWAQSDDGDEASGVGAGEQSAPAPPPRDCKITVRNVRRALCPSRRQRVRICTGGGEGRTVEPLNCV